MASTTATVSLKNSEKDLITDCERTIGNSAAQFMRSCELEIIEDDLDLCAWNEAMTEFDADPVTVSAADIAKKYLLADVAEVL